MFYILYEIRNNLNGKIYVGVHKTRDINDGYMGSGKVICAAIAKYGINNFTKRILEQFDNAAAMFAREKEIVTDEFLLREDVYNLRRGGTGGFDYINKNMDDTYRTIRKANGHKTFSKNRQKSWAGYSEESLKKIWAPWIACQKHGQMKGKKHKLESKIQMSLTKKMTKSQQGEKNSQFGSMWVTNEQESKKIKKTSPIPEGWRKGRKMSN